VSIWKTQEVHDAATRVLDLAPAAKDATHALVEVAVPGFGTTAALMQREGAAWAIARLYTADHVIPGTAAVVVVGVW